MTRRTTMLLIGLSLALPVGARADVPGVRAILPVGEGGSASATDFAAFELTGATPPLFTTDVDAFNALVRDGPGMTDELLKKDFPSSQLGIEGQPVRTETPKPGVTIARDARGVPHISAATRTDVAFGIGYAHAEDRLFAMDALRHLGKGELTAFVGPGTDGADITADRKVLMQSDYDDAERQAMIESLPARFGPAGAAALADQRAYVDGINQRVAEVRADPTRLPAEYVALGALPQPWTLGDTIAVAAEINQGFDLGGGAESRDGQLLSTLEQELGPHGGRRAWDDLRMQEVQRAPTTTDVRFPYPDARRVAADAVAQPDAGSLQPLDPIVGASARIGAAGGSVAGRIGASRLGRGGGESYAVLLGGRRSASGRPIADIGPQVDFFSPELLYDEDLDAGGMKVRGAALPGGLPFPIVGHTDRFAWSVTIGVGDHIDEFAERLCNPDGSPASRTSDHYLHDGACIPFLTRTRTVSTTTSVINPAPPRSYDIRTRRSVHGPIQATATVHGVPVAIARDDATYNHLGDIGISYEQLAQGLVTGPQAFVKIVRRTPFSLNWFYADRAHIAWTLSGRYPLRATHRRRGHAAGPATALPAWGTGAWDWKPAVVPGAQLPHAIDPRSGIISNWNNKPAPGWRAADDVFYYGPIHRVLLYNDRLKAALRGGRRLSEAQLAGLVEDANLVDLRGAYDLPWMLRVIGPKADDPQTQKLLDILTAWAASGAHRQDMNGDGSDDAPAAGRLMDAWWGRAVKAIFAPVIGEGAYSQAIAISEVDDPPPLDAEAFYDGWFGQVEQDLRDVLRPHARGHLSRVYCGGGRGRAACRSVLLASLKDAASAVAAAQGSGDPAAWKLPTTCPIPANGPPPCDEIVFTATGAIETPPVPWQNRPTYQQMVAFP